MVEKKHGDLTQLSEEDQRFLLHIISEFPSPSKITGKWKQIRDFWSNSDNREALFTTVLNGVCGGASVGMLVFLIKNPQSTYFPSLSEIIGVPSLLAGLGSSALSGIYYLRKSRIPLEALNTK